VSVVQGGRVIVARVPTDIKVGSIAACDAIWQDTKRRTADARTGFADMEEKGDAAFHRCFAQRAKSQGFFAAVTKQAQALIDGLPMR
jgi:hypothetical protein